MKKKEDEEEKETQRKIVCVCVCAEAVHVSGHSRVGVVWLKLPPRQPTLTVGSSYIRV